MAITATAMVFSGLMFLAGQSDKGLTHYFTKDDTKVELMKDACFQYHDCSPLNKYLGVQDTTILSVPVYSGPNVLPQIPIGNNPLAAPQTTTAAKAELSTGKPVVKDSSLPVSSP